MKTLLLALSTAVVAFATSSDWVEETNGELARQRWERDIQAFEKLDAEQTYPDDAILFMGSSSIRLWTTLARDMAPFPVIQRGYGGARFSDLAVFAERIVNPHDFRAVVVFVANDIVGDESDLTPKEIATLFEDVVDTVRARAAEAPVFLIAVTPTRARFAVWPKIRAANQALRESCEERGLHFIPTESFFLDDGGQPKEELFRDDQLHLNDDGYALWTEIIRGRLVEVLGEPEESKESER